MLNQFLIQPPSATQIASDPTGVRLPEIEEHFIEVAEDIGSAVRSDGQLMDRYFLYAERLPGEWKERLTLDLMAMRKLDAGMNIETGQKRRGRERRG